MVVIAITGPPGSGKTTIAKLLYIVMIKKRLW